MFLKGFYNSQNIAKHGEKANWTINIKMSVLDSLQAGFFYSFVVTFLIGLIQTAFFL